MKRFYKRLLCLGVAVGVFCSTFVFTAGQTQWTAMQLRKKMLESNIYKIIRSPEPLIISGMGLDYARKIQGLLPAEVRSDLKASARRVAVSLNGEPLPVTEVLGTDCNLASLFEFQVIKGRYLSTDDIEGHEKVCVLKQNLYELVESINAIHIDINGEPYEIVGVVSGSVESSEGFHETSDVFVPVTTLYEAIENTPLESGLVQQILFDKGQHAKEGLIEVLETNAKIQGVDVSELKIMPCQYDVFTENESLMKEFLLVFLISLLVLLIACLNIIHISLASIIDREREIGVRTAVGATPWHITAQITKETLVCALKGGLAGIAATSLTNTIVNLCFNQLALSFNTVSLLAGVILSFMAGLLTSLIPAGKASRLDPIAALREE